MKDNKQLVLNIFISILVLAVIGVGLLVMFRFKENDTISAGGDMEQAENQTGAVEKWQEGDITYDGKKYRYNASVKAYLFLGIDKEGTMAETTGGLVGGQSDAMFVLITNAEAKTIWSRLKTRLVPLKNGRRVISPMMEKNIVIMHR